MDQTFFHEREGAPTLAYRLSPGRGPAVVFLPGFRSDMGGDKAMALAAWCGATGRALLRFDYSGHGESGGAFADGTIGAWRRDALDALDALAPPGPVVLVGSSMGGWIALLVAIARPDRVFAIVGIAAAPDFTEALMWAAMMPHERETLMRDGFVIAPSDYGESYPITRALIEDGRSHLLLAGDTPVPIACPVRLLHGQRDPDVPWETSVRLSARLTSDDLRVTLLKDGDHRLSRPADISLLIDTVSALVGEDAG